jgi:acetoacetate decarboxylase
MRMQATAKLAEAGTTHVGQDTSLGGGSAGGVRVSCKKDGRPRRCRPSGPEVQTVDTADLSRAATYLRYTADEWAGDGDRMTETKETTGATTPRTDISVKEAWTGPARLQLFEHALAPMAGLPVREVVAASHIRVDLILAPFAPGFDYLAEPEEARA